jgi:hypothetical protein
LVGNIDGSGSVTVETNASLTASRIREQSLAIFGVGSVGIVRIKPNGTDAGTSVVNLLSLTGSRARLDLSDNALIVDYAATSSLEQIASLIIRGFAGGSWDGVGINSSVAAATPNRALGFAEATDIGAPAAFAGQPIDSTAVLVRFTLPGDANLDRSVNISDLALLAAEFNRPARWSRGDFNYDNTTDIGDFAILASNFNQGLAAAAPPRVGVPEPAAAAAAAAGTAGAIGLLRPRARRPTRR